MPWDPIIYKLEYTLLTLLASLFWLADRAVLFVTLMVYAIKQFIIDTSSNDGGFVMQTLNQLLTGSDALKNLILLAAGLALLVFSLSRILRPILETNPVDPGRVLLWLAVFSMLLTLGSGFFLDLEQGRDQIRALASQAVIGAGNGSFSPAGIPGNLPNQMRTPQHFPFSGGSGCAVPPCNGGPASNGLDLALAFLFVSQEDEVSTMTGGDSAHQYMPLDFAQRGPVYNPNDPPADPTPDEGYGGYFYWDTAHTDLATNDQRQASVDRAVQGVVRMVAGIPVCLFALLEALIYLAFTIAAAVLFISVPVAMIFAFFRSTEVVMVGLVKSYVALYAKTFAVTGLLTLFFSFLLWFANGGNWGAFMAICIVMLLFAFQFLGLAFGVVKESLGTLTGSMGAALGTPASASQGFSSARTMATTGLAAAGQGMSLAGSGGAMLGRLAMGAVGGPVGLAVGAAGLVAGRQSAARLSGLNSARLTRRPPGAANSPSSAARVARDGASGGAGAASGTGGDRAGALGRIGAADGALVRNNRVGRRFGAAINRAIDQAGNGAAAQAQLARTDLAVADRDRLADLIAERPEEVRAVMSAVAETLNEQPELSFLRDGQFDPISLGANAALDRLQRRVSAAELQRLRDDPAGQNDFRLLVGARLGVERRFGGAELQQGIANAATSGVGIAGLTAGLGIAPHAFGANHAAVDHFVRELNTLGLTSAADAHNALILAREIKRQSPTGDFSPESRARAVKGSLPALGHWERKLVLAAGRAALADGYSDPREAEQRVQRLLRDALETPTTLYAQVVPPAASAAPVTSYDSPTTVMPLAAETTPLEQGPGPVQSQGQNEVPTTPPPGQRQTERHAAADTTTLLEPTAAQSVGPRADGGAGGSRRTGATGQAPTPGGRPRKSPRKSAKAGQNSSIRQVSVNTASDFPQYGQAGDMESMNTMAEQPEFASDPAAATAQAQNYKVLTAPTGADTPAAASADGDWREAAPAAEAVMRREQAE